MRPLAVHHVSINVPDVDAALGFYVDVLGLSVRDDRPDFGFPGAWLDAGGQQLHLIQADAPRGLGQHFALLVDDLAATVDELRGRGIEVGDPSPVGTSLQSFVTDPAGNLVELHQAR
jgi:catechol 2,3-dioxygenase-like lactoylglutathione lyase family enzyme